MLGNCFVNSVGTHIHLPIPLFVFLWSNDMMKPNWQLIFLPCTLPFLLFPANVLWLVYLCWSNWKSAFRLRTSYSLCWTGFVFHRFCSFLVKNCCICVHFRVPLLLFMELPNYIAAIDLVSLVTVMFMFLSVLFS